MDIMGFGFWLKSLFTKETHKDTDFEPIPIFRTETPEKIIETKIKPVKIPTIVDIVDRLCSIFYELASLKTDMVSKTWFETQYEDTSLEIIKRLNDLEAILNNINSKLSNFTKSISEPLSPTHLPTEPPLSISDRIYNFIQTKKNVRYKDIASSLPYSDPTISKHIKILCNNKIKRTKIGKAVYYTLA